MAARLSVITLALLGVLGAAGATLAQKSDRSAAELMDAVMWNREPIGGPFALIDQDGRRRTEADFYLWVMDHRHYLVSQGKADLVEPGQIAEEFVRLYFQQSTMAPPDALPSN